MISAGASTSRSIVLRALCVTAAIALAAAMPAFAQEASPTAAPSPAISSSSTAPIAEAPIPEPVAAPAGPAVSAPVAEVAPAAPPPAGSTSPAAPAVAGAELPPPNPAETPIATLPPNLRALVAEHPTQSPSTAEIPPASAPEPVTGTVDAQPDYTNPEVANYERAQEGISDPAQMQSLRDFMSEGAIDSPIGMELREARRRLASGEEADGLLVIKVQDGSPAAIAGLHGYHRAMHNALTGAAIVAAMLFPPAILVVPALDQTQIGESYDLIIGVDGSRVTNFLDFQDRMRNVRGGELVYLSVVRDGHRKQITVKVPTDMVNLAW
jgi:PDZ domain